MVCLLCAGKEDEEEGEEEEEEDEDETYSPSGESILPDMLKCLRYGAPTSIALLWSYLFTCLATDVVFGMLLCAGT